MSIFLQILITVAVLGFGYCLPRIVDSSYSRIYIRNEFNKLKIGDKYCRYYSCKKEMLKYQKGNRLYAIIKDIKKDKLLKNCKVTVDIYINDSYVYTKEYGLVSEIRFFDNYKRIGLCTCILNLWEKKYNGDAWY